MNDTAPSSIGHHHTPSFSRLIEGVERFRSNDYNENRELFHRLANRQQPKTLFICCADSRVVPELMTQTEPGELFLCRNIGNVVPAYGEMLGGVSAVVEYACVALGVSDVVVCGHSDCGAMKALLDPDDANLKKMPTVASWLRNAEAARSVVEATQPGLEGADKVAALIVQNVRTQLGHLRTHPAVAARLATRELTLHGWVYDIESGDVQSIDETTGALLPLQKAGNASPAGHGRAAGGRGNGIDDGDATGADAVADPDATATAAAAAAAAAAGDADADADADADRAPR